ncbi:hypothetical protein CANINC_002136 [Pichia inconspicua]|uniref:Nonsense-mediated mRNA decay factor n=1 Tax=Pichia inconspicua TaxID=52247 RepID=A0A4T0X227_9ASCO|nr:hypothetical protein CANINC_002136 [[Candida] inconspicua]
MSEEEVTRIPPSLNTDIDALISTNKETIHNVLSNAMDVSDASILQGTLNFSHSKLSSFILDTISYQYNLCNQIDNESDAQQLLVYEKLNSNIRSVGNIIDKVWIDMHHPAIKSYQSLFLQLSKSKDTSIINNKKQSYNNKSKFHNSNTNTNPTNSQNFVEYRKLFDKFVKLVSKALDFYFTLLQTILSQYDLSVYIPVKKICSTLKIDINTITDDKNIKLLPNSNTLISSIVYLIHKCVLYIGDLSRYRTLIAKTYLPSTSISKADNNNYSKSIELYKLSLLILPSLGDPYNHIAIIDNVKDDKFNVVYNFVRASLTSTPLDLAQSNLLNLLNKNSKSNAILRKFENLNGLDRQTITKNDRLSLLKSQFLVLFNYNLLPSRWRSKPGYLVSGHEIKLIEDDFYYLLSTLDFHKQIFNDFYLKQVVILLGGFELLIDPKNIENSRLKQSTAIITDYLAFMFRFLENLLKICIKICNNPNANEQHQEIDEQETPQKLSMAFSTSLLPVIRLLLCWFKEREIARVYLARSGNLANLLAILINRLISYLDDTASINRLKELLPSEKDWSIETVLMTKPSRSRLFKEDVSLREFKPINYMLDDFDDSRFFTKDSNSVLALIGESPIEDKGSTGSVTKFNDNILRLVAIIVLGKRLVLENAKNIQWVPATASDNAINTFIGSFKVDKNVDLTIEPITLNKDLKIGNSKGKEHKPKRKTVESSNSNTKLANTTTYAGSSFSNFGSVLPGSLPKPERPKRNKSNDAFSLERPKTFSVVDSTSNNSFKKDSSKSNKDYNSKTSRRPITSPISTTHTTDYQQNHYSRYADMVANIVNEDSQDTAITSASTGSHSNKSFINESNLEKNAVKSNNNEYMFKWDSGSENTSTQLNSLNSSSSQINSNHDSNLLDRFGFSNTGGAFSSMGDNTKLSSMFEINNMNSFQDTNMSVNRMNSYGSYNVNVDKFLGDSNYINNFNNLNMGLNNYMQSSLNNVNMGSVYNTSTRINDNMNINMNINSNTTPINVSTDVQNAMNYMNSYNGYSNSFNNSNSHMSQFGIPSEVESQIYGTNLHKDSSDRSK